MTACSGREWLPSCADEASVKALAQAAGLPYVVARLLWLRGIQDAQEAARFLEPSVEQLHDPALLQGMQTAVERILHAVRSSQPILIYGDYDVDGTLATVLLKTAIDRITPKGQPSLVRYHIPHRIREGYGVQSSVLAAAAAEGVQLVISVDTGIRAFAGAEEAAELGLDLIVTDHHLPDERGVPCAITVINPNLPDCAYPEKHLCGAAVAWKLAFALLRAAHSDSDGLHAVSRDALTNLQQSLLKLVAIATVADAVPLAGENRVIVSLGLQGLCDLRQPGLRALMRLAQVGGTNRAPRASELAFRVAPRINAAGRMDVASDVVRLLLTRDVAEAEALAAKLHALNEQRRDVEQAVLLELHEQIDVLLADGTSEPPGVFVLDGEGWHRGVVGILASRVVDRTNRPALVITHEAGAAHGSGRSVDGFHLLDAITEAHAQHASEEEEELFLRFGGHAHAVGFSLESDRVPALRRRMSLFAAAQGDSRPSAPPMRPDAELPLHLANEETWAWLCRLEPFGNANEEPVFLARGVNLVGMQRIKDRHLKLHVQLDGGVERECLCWARSFEWPERMTASGIMPGTAIDLLYQLRWNERPAFGGLEIHVCDLRACAPRADVTSSD